MGLWAAAAPLMHTGDTVMGLASVVMSLIVAWLPPDIKS